MTKKRISGLHKGLQILGCFSQQNYTLTAKEIAKELSVPPSTVYRYIDTLIEDGFLIKDSKNNGYRLGYVLLHFGNLVSQSIDFVQTIKPYISELSYRYNETVMLMVLSGERVVCIDKKETSKPIRFSIQIGTVLPLYAGASSKVLLAYQDKEFRENYLEKVSLDKVAPNTITSKQALLDNLENILCEGHAIADQEVNQGVAGIAAPVFNAGGKIVASIVLAGPSDRLIPNQEDLVKAVVASSKEASRGIGYQNHEK